MFEDLRSFIAELKDKGDLLEVEDEVSTVFEIPAALKYLDRIDGPAALFKKVKGYGVRVAGNILCTRKRLALALNCREGQIEDEYVERRKKPIKPVIVKSGPAKEVILRDDIDVLKMVPVLTHHEKDAGPYFTSALLLAKDPNTGIRGMGIHRIQVKGPRRLGLYLHNPPVSTFFQKAEAMGRPLEIAILVGPDPYTYFSSVAWAPEGIDKFEIAGSLGRGPIKLVGCETVDLEVPSACEFVLEGRILPGQRDTEGPFGESSGYYLTYDNPVAEIDLISCRKEPIYQALMVYTREGDVLTISAQAENIKALRDAIPAVRKACFRGRGIGIIQIKKSTEDEPSKVMDYIFANNRSLKVVIVVDDDIDPFDQSEVEWALTTRFQPDEDVIIKSNIEGWGIDPSARNSKYTSKMGMDATKPLGQQEKFEKIDVPRPAADKMKSLIDKALSASRKL